MLVKETWYKICRIAFTVADLRQGTENKPKQVLLSYTVIIVGTIYLMRVKE